MTLAQASLSARAISARVSGVTPRVSRQPSRTCLLTGTLAASRGRWSVMLISMPSSSGRAPPVHLSLRGAIPNPPPGSARAGRSVLGWQRRGEELGEQLRDALGFVVVHPVRGVRQPLDAVQVGDVVAIRLGEFWAEVVIALSPDDQ